MVSTRKSPQKTRPTGVPTLSGQARVRAERAEQRTEQRSAAARANAPVEEAHRPIEEEEVSQLDIVDDDDVYHGNDDDKEECVGSETMDVCVDSSSGGERSLATPAYQGRLALVLLPLGAAINKIKSATLTLPNA